MSERVWRKQTVRYSLNGKRVAKDTPNAQRHVDFSKRYYGTLRTLDGKRKQTPLTEDRKTSLTLLRRLQTQEDTARANGETRYTQERKRPVSELVTAYETHLRNRGNTPRYVKEAVYRVRRLLTATKAKTLADVDANRIANTLAEWRKRKKRPLSVVSSNHYARAIKGFTRFLWTERTTPDDTLAGLRLLNADADRRKIRRALTQGELATLTRVAQQSRKTYRGDDWRFTPTDRAMLYELAAYTGLRASELASLTRASFDFEQRTVFVSASATKNRKAATLPLNASLAERLLVWVTSLNRDALFPGSWAKRCQAGKILKRDLKRCGIAYRDEQGRTVDFHALRYTFITSLARSGVHPAKAQRLARHSTITLTMDVYTSLDVDDLRDAINSITPSTR